MTGEERTEAAMIAELRERGYLVIKVPQCKHAGRGHGRHGLVTRTAMCEGEEPIPHGFQSGHFGSFGFLIRCACGQQFADYGEPNEWDQHQAEHNLKASADA